MQSLNGKTILVTGASRGIGASIAAACKSAGARVLAHASGPTPALGNDALVENLAAADAGARLFEKAVEKAGRIDAVVNNAGVYRTSKLRDDGDWSRGWDETLAVNLRAAADLSRAAVAHFRDSGGGRIVNIASRAGQRGDDIDHAAYAASKGGLVALTKTFARALAGENILFYCIAPGWVETRMAPEDVAARDKAVADIPLGRVAQPDEIGALVAFLLSDACPSATGSTFDVNGASYVR
jgi:NAD(P)-dependent dehydrogenase (short-subunit alcohol dehydrogenase family)